VPPCMNLFRVLLKPLLSQTPLGKTLSQVCFAFCYCRALAQKPFPLLLAYLFEGW
jgi:hypothetical protein